MTNKAASVFLTCFMAAGLSAQQPKEEFPPLPETVSNMLSSMLPQQADWSAVLEEVRLHRTDPVEAYKFLTGSLDAHLFYIRNERRQGNTPESRTIAIDPAFWREFTLGLSRWTAVEDFPEQTIAQSSYFLARMPTQDYPAEKEQLRSLMIGAANVALSRKEQNDSFSETIIEPLNMLAGTEDRNGEDSSFTKKLIRQFQDAQSTKWIIGKIEVQRISIVDINVAREIRASEKPALNLFYHGVLMHYIDILRERTRAVDNWTVPEAKEAQDVVARTLADYLTHFDPASLDISSRPFLADMLDRANAFNISAERASGADYRRYGAELTVDPTGRISIRLKERTPAPTAQPLN